MRQEQIIIYVEGRNDKEIYNKIQDAIDYLERRISGMDIDPRGLWDLATNANKDEPREHWRIQLPNYEQSAQLITRRRHDLDHEQDLLLEAPEYEDHEKTWIVFTSACDSSADAIEAATRKTNCRITWVRDKINIEREWNSTTKRVVEALIGNKISGHDLITGVEWDGGRPPIGTESWGGRLRPTDDYAKIRRVLQHYIDGWMTQKEAAKNLGCAPATIDNASKKVELYQLKTQSEPDRM